MVRAIMLASVVAAVSAGAVSAQEGEIESAPPVKFRDVEVSEDDDDPAPARTPAVKPVHTPTGYTVEQVERGEYPPLLSLLSPDLAAEVSAARVGGEPLLTTRLRSVRAA